MTNNDAAGAAEVPEHDAGAEIVMGPAHSATDGGGEGGAGGQQVGGADVALSEHPGVEIVRGPAQEATDGDAP
jgi:hypothetical protein